MAKILTQIEALNIRNIRLYAGDAAELLAWAPPRSMARIDLIHPDPWPKRRHWKRRFVQDATVAAMARIIKPGGEFRFVSDIDDYCAWTLAHLMRSPDFLWTAERAIDWRQPWDGYTMTRYGRKAEREGRVAAYLRFRRNKLADSHSFPAHPQGSPPGTSQTLFRFLFRQRTMRNRRRDSQHEFR